VVEKFKAYCQPLKTYHLSDIDLTYDHRNQGSCMTHCDYWRRAMNSVNYTRRDCLAFGIREDKVRDHLLRETVNHAAESLTTQTEVVCDT